ncbi:trans-sulfuration enzyme family protein [Halalkalibacterium ligniniphilum]|uniref:trans-sulfuration enzyme family protein n=2 Tax=Halalkalibacterium ligniniphilum TaxID=1134413 RepID=UPI00034BE785|nr:aminotransferase class I/II-fold pyridoxal phosphate-dependent enzyme [Halalkalibacterium ligniniphilum]
MGEKRFNFNTKAVHFSEKDIAKNVSKAKPIYQTSAFVFSDLNDMESFYQGEKEYLYTRYSNPNTDDLAKGVAQLENAEDGVSTSSGMSAILAGILAVVKPGESIIASNDLYGGTYQLFADELPNFGINVRFVSFENLNDVEEQIEESTVLLYTESITNPLLRVEEIDKIVALAAKYDLKTMIDNTFATPYLLRPIDLGVDLVVHSATKYIGGHSDVTAGVVVGPKNLIAKAKAKVVTLGCNLTPFEGWLACRGLKTLALRMERQCENAQEVASSLADNAGVDKVYYPTNVSKQGNGAIVTIKLAKDINIETFFQTLAWIKIAPTLAGVETTVSYPLRTSHRTVPSEVRESLGIDAQVVRLSIGIEDAQDIIDTLVEAIEQSKNDRS